MQTSAYVTYMGERLNANLTRENILDMMNKAQNEILSNDNRITQIVPDPFIHTGSDVLAAFSEIPNAAGETTFEVDDTIPLDTPTRGFLRVTDAGITDKLPYQSYTGTTFNLEDGETLPRTYSINATSQVDQFDLKASGALFTSIKNDPRRTQWDIRRVSRVYAYTSNVPGAAYFGSGYGLYGISGGPSSRKPDIKTNVNDPEIKINADTEESLEPLSGDARIIFWEDNAPPTNPSSNLYRARAYRWADQLTNEAVPLTIPARFQTTLLKWAIFKDEEYREWGAEDRPKERYDEELKKFLSWAEGGSQTTKRTATTPRF